MQENKLGGASFIVFHLLPLLPGGSVGTNLRGRLGGGGGGGLCCFSLPLFFFFFEFIFLNINKINWKRVVWGKGLYRVF
jgi:hypothetical protein